MIRPIIRRVFAGRRNEARGELRAVEKRKKKGSSIPLVKGLRHFPCVLPNLSCVGGTSATKPSTSHSTFLSSVGRLHPTGILVHNHCLSHQADFFVPINTVAFSAPTLGARFEAEEEGVEIQRYADQHFWGIRGCMTWCGVKCIPWPCYSCRALFFSSAGEKDMQRWDRLPCLWEES